MNIGLVPPGKCESCGAKGPRLKFYNGYADPPITMDLCPACMDKALRCLSIFLHTPAGREVIRKHMEVIANDH